MWKCKKCGCDCFCQDIIGGISEVLEMDKEGEVLDEIDDVEYGDFRVQNAIIQVRKYKKLLIGMR